MTEEEFVKGVITDAGTLVWTMPDDSMDNGSKHSICEGDIVEFEAKPLAESLSKETLCFATDMVDGSTTCRIAVSINDKTQLRPLNPNKALVVKRNGEVMLHKVIRITRLL